MIGHRVNLHDQVKALELLGRHLNLFPAVNQRPDPVQVHVRKRETAPLPAPELSARIVYLLEVAAERQQEAEQAGLRDHGEESNPRLKK